MSSSDSEVVAGTLLTAAAASIRLSLFGRFKLEQAGRAVRLRTRKEEALLAYVVVYPEKHTREALAELFWGATPEQQARASLRAALANLRSALPDMLLSDRVVVQFRPKAALWVDALEFRAQATAFLSEELADPAAFNAGLYTGELLAGHYDDWVLDERERFRRLYLETLLHLVGRLRALARYEEAIAVAQQALSVDPAEERAHQHLIFLYDVTGDRSAALRQLELCRRKLKEELAVEPSAATLAVVASIASAATPDAAPAQFGNLPTTLTSFVGREAEMAALSELLGRGSRLVTLTGAGGSGKTRLALQVSRSRAPNYCHGAWWVDLSSLTEPAMVADTALSVLGPAPAPGQPPLQTLIDFLRGRTLLLALDNCEHLAEACARLAAAILESCPSVQVLATSREPLGVPGEQLWPVPTFSVPAAGTGVAAMLGYDAVRLFVERARMHRPSFSLGGHNADQVAEICRRLDGIPLAIELAAARVRSMEADEILGRLQNRLRLLATGSRLAPPRQQTLRTSIDWSYNLLSPAECLLLGRLAVFVGGCTLAAAEAVCAGGELAEVDVLDLLGRLVDRSLVVAEAGRYRLLETIREYALERLADVGEAAALRERHAAYFAAYLSERYDAILTSEQHRVKVEITAEIGNIRAAWDWAVAARRADLLRCSERALVWYCELYGRFYEGEALFARAVEQLAAEPAADPGLLALLRAEHGYSLARLGRLAAAREELEQGCAHLRQVGSPADLATGLTLLGMVVWQEGDYPRAQALLEESLALNRRVDDRGMVGLCLFFLGMVDQTTGNAATAEAYFGEALALGRSSDHPRLIAMTSVHSVPSLLALSQPAQARERLQEGLALAHATQDRWLEFAALGYLGRVLGAQGDYAGAKTALQETLALAHETGNRQDQAWAEVGLGDVALAAGEAAQAELHYRSGLQLAMEAAALPKALDAVAGLAVLRARAGDREGALALAGQVSLHPASTGNAHARVAEVLRMVDPESGSLPAALRAGTLEELVHGILSAS